MLRIFNPAVFQGSFHRKQYFEGWYFKNVASDLEQVYAFIPGISQTKEDKHAFIQVINGISGQTHYIKYDINEFSYLSDHFQVKIANNTFTKDFIELDIRDKDIRVAGRLDYISPVEYPSRFMAPGIMGWYSFVPFMECYHGVVSVNHGIEGTLQINEKPISFSGGKGYIEKDWGRSFPECWIWLQSNSFENHDESLFVSIAKIPWLGRYFIGFIAFLYKDGVFTQFSTYNRSSLKQLTKQGKELFIELENKSHTLQIEVKVENAGDLVAPVKGQMTRMIKESIDSKVNYTLVDKKNNAAFKGHSDRAGLEIIEGIFNYF